VFSVWAAILLQNRAHSCRLHAMLNECLEVNLIHFHPLSQSLSFLLLGATAAAAATRLFATARHRLEV
jgi:hypothetical protein